MGGRFSQMSELSSTEPNIQDSIKAVIYTHPYFNIVSAICVPLGIMSHLLNWSASATFIINIFAIIGLAKMLDLATDQLSMKVGEAVGALLNASFGNAVELIVGIIALKDGKLEIVQASLIGSVLSNLLLVLGFCFLLGGFKHPVQRFNQLASQTGSSLFILTQFGFMLPAIFFQEELSKSADSSKEIAAKALALSRGLNYLT